MEDEPDGIVAYAEVGASLIHLLARMVQGKSGHHVVEMCGRSFAMQIVQDDSGPVVVVKSRDH